MKRFPFILINKNNMTKIRHFSNASDVAVHLIGRKLDDIMVIVNECQIVHIDNLGTGDINKIERILNEVNQYSC